MRHRGGSTTELGVDGNAVLLAVRLQQGVVVNRVAGHEDEFAASAGLHREVEIACQTTQPAHLQRCVELCVGPVQQARLKCFEPGARHGGPTFEFAVTRPLVVVHAARLGRRQQRLIVFDDVAQVGSDWRGIVSGTGGFMRPDQHQSLRQDVDAELQQALRIGVGMG